MRLFTERRPVGSNSRSQMLCLFGLFEALFMLCAARAPGLLFRADLGGSGSLPAALFSLQLCRSQTLPLRFCLLRAPYFLLCLTHCLCPGLLGCLFRLAPGLLFSPAATHGLSRTA